MKIRGTWTLGLACLLLGSGACGLSQAVPQQGTPADAARQGLDTPAAQAPNQSSGRTGESPLDTPVAQQGKDASAVSSPVPEAPKGTSIRVGTDVRVTLTAAVSSGVQKNGDTVQGKLASAVRTNMGFLPAGTPVKGTVVSAAKAGEIASGGVLSLQLTSVGGVHVITDVRDFSGAEGHKDVADAAPAKGAEAVVALGTLLQFRVMQQGKATGIVPGVPPAKGNGGQNGGTQNSGAQNAEPRTSQTPAGGATQGVVPRGSTPR